MDHILGACQWKGGTLGQSHPRSVLLTVYDFLYPGPSRCTCLARAPEASLCPTWGSRVVQRSQAGKETQLQSHPPEGTVTPQLVTLSCISMMSTEHREIKTTRHLDHNIRSKTSLPYRHQGHVSSNMVEQQQLMVQRQLFRQICACLKPSWKISQGTCQARSNVWSLNEAGEAVCSSQSWMLQGLCKHQIKQSPDKAHRETMRLNPRSSLGTIQHKPNHSSKEP